MGGEMGLEAGGGEAGGDGGENGADVPIDAVGAGASLEGANENYSSVTYHVV